MITRATHVSATSLLTLCLLTTPSLAHMEMKSPFPFRSKFNPATPPNLIDYNMKAPLTSTPLNFPCKGYQTDTSGVVATYDAGATYNISLDGTANHGGGSCQLSLSYDDGKTFKVIKSFIGGCTRHSTYNFTVPTYAPAGHALFAWTWSNFMGNREFYMNCALVHIDSTTSSLSFDKLPNVWVADLESVNSCTTDGPTGSMNPVYPNPGPDVVYDAGMSKSSPPTPGDCEVPLRSRQVAAHQFESDPQASSSTNIGIVSSSSSLALASTTFPTSLSTTTLTLDCPATITITVPPTMIAATYTVSAPTSICTGTSALCPCANGYACMAVGTCTWECLAMSMTAISSFQTFAITSTGSLLPSATSIASPATSSTAAFMQPSATNIPSANRPDYAAVDDLQAYLPCKSGTFICTDASTWYTCDVATDGSYHYQYPRNVAVGMQCLPNLSLADGSTAQQGNTPAGYYRNDQYAKAAPLGSCSATGAVQCTNGGHGFEVCDDGAWVDMGAVAADTMCVNGQMVSA